MQPTRFSHMALNCQDQAAIEQFYSQYFGFRRARVIDLGDSKILFLKSGDAYLELFPAKGQPPVPPADKDGPTYAGFRHIAFQVDDIDAKLAELGPAARVSHGPDQRPDSRRDHRVTMNRYGPHVYVIPEDDANRQIADASSCITR